MELVKGRCFLIILTILIIFVCHSESLRRVKRIVGGINAAKPPEDDPVVFVNKHDRNSKIYGSRDSKKGFYVFRGIRYAEPPVGRSRFQRPRVVPLDGEYNATQWGPPCPQVHDGVVIGSEDCLFLNVFTPALPDTGDGYPVLIWIHGGGFRTGAATQFGMRNLIDKRMVVVSIQYRLGSLGFLSTGSQDLPGNNGMFDMALAVAWVKKYIEYFGGNPNKVVAMGQGTGASAAMMLSSSSFGKESFSGLIAMSGSLLSNFVTDKNPMKTTQYIASANGCPYNEVSEMVNCLRELPAEQMVSIDSKLSNNQMVTDGFIAEISSRLGPGPVVEGHNDGRSLPNFVTDKPEDVLSHGDFPKIPLLTGVVKDETGGAILGGYRKEVEEKLKSIPDFLKKVLVTSLQDTIPFFGNTSKQFIPDAFGKYLKIPSKGNLEGRIKKIAEAVSDAIFNVPAFLTVTYWSKRAKTYFYSFDHETRRAPGKDFLSGVPLVDARNSSSGITGHGDDLGFVFDHNDIFGNDLPAKSIDSNDEKVTETFTTLISQFARTGEVKNDKSNEAISPFSSDDHSYISITDKITPMKNFRFCEMGLWIGAVEKLASSSCDVMRVTTETIERLEKRTQKIVDIVSSPIDTIKKPVEKVKEAENKLIPKVPKIPVNIPKVPGFGFLG